MFHPSRSKRYHRRQRRGNIVMLSCFFLVSLLGMAAFAIDIAYLTLAREEMQRTADSAALAGAWELVDDEALTGRENSLLLEDAARAKASTFASQNQVLRSNPTVPEGNVSVGYLANPNDPNETFDTTGANPPNAVRVIVRRSASQNGLVPFFLGQILGVDSAPAEAEATAVILTEFGGFRTPASGGCVDVLPFALDEDTWNDLLKNGVGQDRFRWNADSGQVEPGTDRILEVNLFPHGTGSPGNRGTIDIGSGNNSTADIARQILHGVSADDLAYHGGSLVFDEYGAITLNGDTGISAGVKDELATIVGEPRVIPIFSQVTGPGNNAQYTIVRFAGIRIVEVKLTGPMSGKRVMVQPANMACEGAVISTISGTSNFVYSPAWIVR